MQSHSSKSALPSHLSELQVKFHWRWLKVLQSYLLGVQWLLPKKNLRKLLSPWNNLPKKEINHQTQCNWTYGVNQLHDPCMVKNKQGCCWTSEGNCGKTHTLPWRYLCCIWVRIISAKDVTWKWYYFMEQTQKSLKSCIYVYVHTCIHAYA